MNSQDDEINEINNQQTLVNSDAYGQMTPISFSPAETSFENNNSQPWGESGRHYDSQEGRQPSPTMSQIDFEIENWRQPSHTADEMMNIQDDEETIFDAHMEDDESINSDVWDQSLLDASSNYDPESIIKMFHFTVEHVVSNKDEDENKDENKINIHRVAKNSNKNVNNYLQESETNLCIEYIDELYLTSVYDLKKNVLGDSKSIIVRLNEGGDHHKYYDIEFLLGTQCYVSETLFSLLSNPFCCQTIKIFEKEDDDSQEYILYENLIAYNETTSSKFIENSPIQYYMAIGCSTQYPADYVFPEINTQESEAQHEDLHFNVLIQGVKIKILFSADLTIGDVKQQLSEKVKIEVPHKYSQTQFTDVSKQIKLIHMGKILKENETVQTMMEKYGNGFTMNGLIRETIGGKKSKKYMKGVSNKKTKKRKSKNK